MKDATNPYEGHAPGLEVPESPYSQVISRMIEVNDATAQSALTKSVFSGPTQESEIVGDQPCEHNPKHVYGHGTFIMKTDGPAPHFEG